MFSLQLYQKKETPVQVFSCEFCKIFKTHSFKYTSRWLLLKKHLISLKLVPEAIDINVSNASYRKEFVLLSFLGSAYDKFVEIFVGTFFLLIELFEGKEIDFSSKLDFFFFKSCLTLKMFKLQIISGGNANKKAHKKKKIIKIKKPLTLSQHNAWWKPSLRKLDLLCHTGIYRFQGLLLCAKQII